MSKNIKLLVIEDKDHNWCSLKKERPLDESSSQQQQQQLHKREEQVPVDPANVALCTVSRSLGARGARRGGSSSARSSSTANTNREQQQQQRQSVRLQLSPRNLCAPQTQTGSATATTGQTQQQQQQTSTTNASQQQQQPQHQPQQQQQQHQHHHHHHQSLQSRDHSAAQSFEISSSQDGQGLEEPMVQIERGNQVSTWICCMPCYWLRRSEAVHKALLTFAMLLVTVLLVASPVLFLITTLPEGEQPRECTLLDEACIRERDGPEGVCESRACHEASRSMLATMQRNVDPCKDFYQFACGNFHNQLPYQPASSFAALQEQVDDQIQRMLLNETGRMVGAFTKLGQFYNSCLEFQEKPVDFAPGNENENVSLQSKSPLISAYIDLYARTVIETVEDLKYLLKYWQEILLVEQNEIMRLRIFLGEIVRKISPSNKIRHLTINEIVKNDNVIFPVIKQLNAYLKHVRSFHQNNKKPTPEDEAIFTQEIELLSVFTNHLYMDINRILQFQKKIPSAEINEIYVKQRELDRVIKTSDSLSPKNIPTREKLIVKRYAMMPVIIDLQRLLSNIEAKYLRGKSVPGQAGQQGLAEQLGSKVQTAQAGPSGSSGQGGQSGQPPAKKPRH